MSLAAGRTARRISDSDDSQAFVAKTTFSATTERKVVRTRLAARARFRAQEALPALTTPLDGNSAQATGRDRRAGPERRRGPRHHPGGPVSPIGGGFPWPR